MASSPRIKTRILIISDTHGIKPHESLPGEPTTDDEFSQADITRIPTGYRFPLPEADVALHCGDLTKSGRPVEFARTFAMLRAIRAPLKLVIAGNHDVALDKEFWEEACRGSKEEAEKVKQTITEAETDGVKYLTEGTHSFDLQNGARLKVYASQFTPQWGEWAFQYWEGHDFDIPPDVDVAMTHGPPKAVLDYAGRTKSQAGCDQLFRAIHRARPQIHCYGHIHEAWGAFLAQWKEAEDGQVARRETVIDEDASRSIKLLAGVSPSEASGDEDAAREKRESLRQLSKQRAVAVDLTEGENRLTRGEQTLFVNAAIMDMRYRPIQFPWLVDLDLPQA